MGPRYSALASLLKRNTSCPHMYSLTDDLSTYQPTHQKEQLKFGFELPRRRRARVVINDPYKQLFLVTVTMVVFVVTNMFVPLCDIVTVTCPKQTHQTTMINIRLFLYTDYKPIYCYAMSCTEADRPTRDHVP